MAEKAVECAVIKLYDHVMKAIESNGDHARDLGNEKQAF